MTPCQQARILTWCTRGLAVAATGAVSWYVAQPIAQYFGHSLSDPMQIGVGCLFALAALFVSKRALDFTQDCMTVPDSMASAAHNPASEKPTTCRKKACHLHTDDVPTDAPIAGTPPKTCAADPKSFAPQNLTTTVADTQTMKVSVQTADGITTVTVVINGVSAAKFKDKQNGLRKKLESVGGINWDNPKNLGNGSRQMTGRIGASVSRESVITRLQQIANAA